MNAKIQQRVQLAIFFLLFHFLVNRSPSQFWSLFFTSVCLESRTPLIPIQPVSSPWFKFPLQFSFKVNSPSLFCPLTLLWYSVIGFHTHGQVSTSGHCSSGCHLCRLSSPLLICKTFSDCDAISLWSLWSPLQHSQWKTSQLSQFSKSLVGNTDDSETNSLQEVNLEVLRWAAWLRKRSLLLLMAGGLALQKNQKLILPNPFAWASSFNKITLFWNVSNLKPSPADATIADIANIFLLKFDSCQTSNTQLTTFTILQFDSHHRHHRHHCCHHHHCYSNELNWIGIVGLRECWQTYLASRGSLQS